MDSRIDRDLTGLKVPGFRLNRITLYFFISTVEELVRTTSQLKPSALICKRGSTHTLTLTGRPYQSGWAEIQAETHCRRHVPLGVYDMRCISSEQSWVTQCLLAGICPTGRDTLLSRIHQRPLPCDFIKPFKFLSFPEAMIFSEGNVLSTVVTVAHKMRFSGDWSH